MRPITSRKRLSQLMRAAMSFSLFADVVSALRPPLAALLQGRAVHSKQRRAKSGNRTIPSVEILEDRFLPSAALPASDVPLLIEAEDVLEATAPKGNPTVAFLGDSISSEYAYGTGAAVWDAVMAPLGMANYGVYGQTTQNLLFQLYMGQLVGIQPAVVVVEIGANDLLHGGSPKEAAAGILTDVDAIHLFQPFAHVLVLGVLPGHQSPSDPYRIEVAQTNQLVSQMLSGDAYATFLDPGSIFLQPDGAISTSMMFDFIHPTEQGYFDMTDILLPAIEQSFFSMFAAIPALPSFPKVSSLMPADIPPSSPPSSPIPLVP